MHTAIRSVLFTLTVAVSLLAQVPVLDQRSLNAKFHVIYGAYERNRAGTIMGSITFDGAGKYSYSGRAHFTGESPKQISGSGFYRIEPDGNGLMTALLDPTMPPIGLRLSADLATIGGSTLDQNTSYFHDLLLAVQVPARSVTPTDLAASFHGLTFLYAPGPPVVARTGFYRFAFDGRGGVTSARWTYHQANQNDGAVQETSSTGSYGLSADGTGFYTSSQGRKLIAVAADANTYIGTDEAAEGEIIYGVREPQSIPAEGLQGRYHWLQIGATAPGSVALRSSEFSWSVGNTLQGWQANGLNRGNGWATLLDSATGRLINMAAMTGPFTINNDGSTNVVFGGPGTPTVGACGADGRVFPWVTLNPTTPGIYVLNIAFRAPSFEPASNQTVFLDPNGAMHAATLSPHPSGFAPGTLMVVRGRGLADSAVAAGGLPLPKTLGGTSLTANGEAAPLVSVSPEQITFLLPSSTAGAGRVRLRVMRGAVASNEITVRAVANLPALFSQTGDGLGDALAFHADGAPVAAENPAVPGETIVFYGAGLGSVAPAIADGVAPPSAPLSVVTTPLQVQIGATLAEVQFAGLAPGYPGVYQINAVVPRDLPSNPATPVRLFQGYAQTHPKVTIAVRR